MTHNLHSLFSKLAKEGYHISTEQSELDFEMIFAYLSGESYWAQGRTRARMKKAIAGSLCFGLYHKEVQVGFARVITDYATRAYLADLFIIEGHRGRGLGKWLVHTILQDSDLTDVPGWLLHTMDAHGLYEQFGFEKTIGSNRIMEMKRG